MFPVAPNNVPMRLNKPMRWTTGFALAVIALLAWNQSQYLGADQLISSYGAATCLSPYQRDQTSRNPIRTWDHTLDLGGSVRVRLEGYSFVGSWVTAHYSDESEQRVIARPGDYVYPYDIRSNWASRRLYALADGLYGGLWRRTELYEYDLAARRSIRRALVHPERLPASCPGGA
jgi:hypothetical protein